MKSKRPYTKRDPRERTFIVSTRLDPKRLDQFERLAYEQHRSLSALLRICLEDQLEILLNNQQGSEERQTHETARSRVQVNE
jgi:hypothetical protein